MKKLAAGTVLMPRTLTTMRDEPVGLFAGDVTTGIATALGR